MNILTIIGARPQFIRVAVISRMLRSNDQKHKINELLFNSLINPNNYSEVIDIKGFNKEQLLIFLRQMKLIRLAENKLALGRKEKIIGGPVHLGVGQEAIAVGISSRLRKTDRVFGAHRSHSHVLAMGADIFKLFAEVLGRDAGLSKGMGGSMHLWDQPNSFYGSVFFISKILLLLNKARAQITLNLKG